MKTFTALATCAIFGAAVPGATAQGQRRGLQPDAMHLLIRATDYTFHQICRNYVNPDMYFNEVELYKDIAGLSNDFSMYLWGSSITDGHGNGIHDLPFTDQRKQIHDMRSTKFDSDVESWLKDYLDAGSRPHSNRDQRADISLEEINYHLNSQYAHRQASHSRILRGANAAPKLDCDSFEKDLRQFSESFQNMSYAISEKCYRQCQPQGYVSYAVQSLQQVFERHYNGGFYTQVREIEAETGCRFDDIFMIDNERAIDYSKIWISTFQSHEKPCAGLTKAKAEYLWAK